MTQALMSLRDVADVEGSFVVDLQGQVLHSDLNAFFRPELLASAGRRIGALLSIIDDNFSTAQELVLRFDGYSLFVHRSGTIVLCVLGRNMPAIDILKMTTRMVLRTIEAERSQPAPTSAPPMWSTPAPLTPPPASVAPVAPVLAPAAPPSAPLPPPKPKKSSIWG